jgi:hypothetical protein
MANDEPKLCSDCPLICLLGDIKRRSWTQEPERPTTVQLCRRLRAEAMKYPDLECPYYARETLVSFMPWPARTAWARKARAHGLNRFLDHGH